MGMLWVWLYLSTNIVWVKNFSRKKWFVNQLFLKKGLWNKSSQKMVYGTIFLKILVYETILFKVNVLWNNFFQGKWFIEKCSEGKWFMEQFSHKENGLWNNFSQGKWFLWNLVCS